MILTSLHIDYRCGKIKIPYGDDSLSIRFREENIQTVKDRSHARSIRKKINFNQVITGDILFTELFFDKGDDSNHFGLVLPAHRTGLAIARNNKIIWYSMPGKPEGTRTREILIEKAIKVFEELRNIKKRNGWK